MPRKFSFSWCSCDKDQSCTLLLLRVHQLVPGGDGSAHMGVDNARNGGVSAVFNENAMFIDEMEFLVLSSSFT